MIIKEAIVNDVAAALIVLYNVYGVAAVLLEKGNAFVLLQHATWGRTSKIFTAKRRGDYKSGDRSTCATLCNQPTRKVICHPYSLIVQLSGVLHPCAKCGFHLCHISGVDQRLNQAVCGEKQKISGDLLTGHMTAHEHNLLWKRTVPFGSLLV